MDLPRTEHALCQMPQGRRQRATGQEAEKLIPHSLGNRELQISGLWRLQRLAANWNSNTFLQAVLDAVPELNAMLPATAIGKD